MLQWTLRMHMSFQISVVGFFGEIPRSGIAGSFFVFCYITFVLKSIFLMSYCHPSFFFHFHLHEISFFIPLLSVSVCLLIWRESHVSSISMHLVFLFIQPPFVFWLKPLIHLHLNYWYVWSYYNFIIQILYCFSSS